MIVRRSSRRWVYLDNKYADTDDGRISRRILDSCGITYRQVLVDA